MKNNRPAGIRMPDLEEPGRDPFRLAVSAACEGFCEYFKGDGGERECGGFSAILFGLRSGIIRRSHLEGISGFPPPSPRRIEDLAEDLCACCGYRQEGCDYQSPHPPPEATPCGGYRLIQILLERGVLESGQLKKMCGPASMTRESG